jgi:hypothetical protein
MNNRRLGVAVLTVAERYLLVVAGSRSFGPETIVMFGDLPEGTYAVMAYVATGDPREGFDSGCETISMYSG